MIHVTHSMNHGLWFYSLAVSEQQFIMTATEQIMDFIITMEMTKSALERLMMGFACSCCGGVTRCWGNMLSVFRSGVTGVVVLWVPSHRLASPSWKKPRPGSWRRKWDKILSCMSATQKKKRKSCVLASSCDLVWALVWTCSVYSGV